MAKSGDRATLMFAGFHPLLLEDSRLQTEPEYESVALSVEDNTLLPAVDRLRPAIVLLDLMHMNSLRSIRRIRAISPSSRVLALIGLRYRELADFILSAGASGIIQRDRAATEVSSAVKAVMSGRRYLSPSFEQIPPGAREKKFRQTGRRATLDSSFARETSGSSVPRFLSPFAPGR
jgi:DNA-binding NarL/FixJ family response regulator